MIKYYKGCEIEIYRDNSITGEEHLFYGVFNSNGYEIACGYSSSQMKVLECYEEVKEIVDDYLINPHEYINCE